VFIDSAGKQDNRAGKTHERLQNGAHVRPLGIVIEPDTLLFANVFQAMLQPGKVVDNSADRGGVDADDFCRSQCSHQVL
jgi:hypothetical protein